MKIIGHRGAPAYRPENTLRSFEEAISCQVSMIELDIYVCASGELVVIHDDRVDRTTNGKGLVEEMDLTELKGLDAGEGEAIPTLSEVMAFTGKRVPLNIELKGRNTAAALSRFLDSIPASDNWIRDNILVSSFNLPELLEFKHLKPEIRRGALNGGIPLDLGGFATPLEPWSLHYNLEFLNEEMVKDAHERSMRVFIYTVNHRSDYMRLKSWGVDGIFTNCPGAFAV